jgi:hypothetical protein
MEDENQRSERENNLLGAWHICALIKTERRLEYA